MNLGDSYPTYANTPVLQVITQGQGQTKTSEVQFPTGKKTSSVNIYSRTYKSPSQADSREVANYGKDDPYTATESNYQYPSMIASSAVVGLIGLVISYAIAVPLGSAMARFKNTWIDSFSTGAFDLLDGSSNNCLGLYRSFWLDLQSACQIHSLSWVLEIGVHMFYQQLSLVYLGAPGTAIWIRRYMIDLQSQDFVRFARAKGLSEKEISNKHIFKKCHGSAGFRNSWCRYRGYRWCNSY